MNYLDKWLRGYADVRLMRVAEQFELEVGEARRDLQDAIDTITRLHEQVREREEALLEWRLARRQLELQLAQMRAGPVPSP